MKKKFGGGFDLSQRMKESCDDLGINLGGGITEIDPNKINNWVYRDRSSFEIGSIEELADSIKKNGQVQPIIVVKLDETFRTEEGNLDGEIEYVVIAGYRRWLACKYLRRPVQAIVKELTLSEAVGVLVSENEKESVCDYSKGIFYSKILDEQAITQTELCERVNLEKNKLSNLMAFAALPVELVISIGDMSNVSARTAGYLRSLCNKGVDYIEALRAFADEIRKGAGEKVIERYINAKLKQKEHLHQREKPEKRVIEKGKNKITVNGGTIKLKFEDDEQMQNFIESVVKRFEHEFSDE